MLVYLDGGPLDGQVWDTAALVGRLQPNPDAKFYEWTAEVKEGKTGRVASVWRYNDARAAGRTVE